jgi:hypothetical protein
MEKWGFGLSKTEGLQTISRYVNENKITTILRGGVPGEDFLSVSQNAQVKTEKTTKN